MWWRMICCPRPWLRLSVYWRSPPSASNGSTHACARLEISRVELKKRGAPFAPEDLRGRLKLAAQGRPGVVIFTRLGDQPLMLLAERVEK